MVRIISVNQVEQKINGAGDIPVLSKSTADSEGVLISSEEQNVYIPNDITDKQGIIDKTVENLDNVKNALEKTADALDKLAQALSQTPASNGSPIDPSLQGQLQPLINELGTNIPNNLNQLKDDFNQLKEDLK
ncbi:MAG: hypothetical protein CMF19_09340 [Idiomarinaceae bacterium]|nr:hypothetical protein [Idiomarinaceae bacterium]